MTTKTRSSERTTVTPDKGIFRTSSEFTDGVCSGYLTYFSEHVGRPLLDADIYPELMYNLCDARGTDLFNAGYAVGWVEALLEDRRLFGIVPEMAR
jgi:hypothetical protein